MDYNIKKSIDKLYRGEATFFLDPLEYKLVSSKFKKNEYKVFNCYEDSDKKILYVDQEPNVVLFKINTKGILKHSDILGALFSLNIDSSVFGDIIVDGDNYYVYVLEYISDYIEHNLTMIGNNSVSFERIDLSILKDYSKKYEILNTIVPSLRIDAVISKVIGDSRNNILERIKNKEVIVNYAILKNSSYILKENDIFSIRRFGKYKFSKVVKNTKKDNYVIEYFKFI